MRQDSVQYANVGLFLATWQNFYKHTKQTSRPPLASRGVAWRGVRVILKYKLSIIGRVELGCTDLVLCDTSFITLYIMW